MKFPSADRAMTRVFVVAGCVLFLLLLVRTAWLDDDAYITFRTVDNFLNGYGLRWNIANRVQAYTHPLWMFAVTGAAAITGEVYYSSILLSVLLSVATVAIVLSRVAVTPPRVALAFSAFILSKAFVDYSTGGLENPLTHLLLALFFVTVFGHQPLPRRLLTLSLLTALLMLNRVDTGLLVLPTLAVEVWRAGLRRSWKPLAIGITPLLAWESFSLVYYGFLVPNTAYSKLQHGVPRPEILYQGFLYLLDSIGNDPLTLLVIFGALVSPLAGVRGWTIPAGIALYVAYIVWVGGDFMSGRFLTGPFIAALIHLVRQGAPEFNVGWALATVLVWLTGLSAPRPTIVSTSSFGSDIEPARVIAATGITDERRYYYPQSGLLTVQRGTPMPNHKWLHMGHDLRARGERLFQTDAAGFIGYAAGPTVHFIDKYGLGDALIARLPAEAPWRIGHFVRRVPDGYPETITSGQNVIADAGVAAYYERLRVITEGPLFSSDRLQTILRMNLGRYEHYISSYGLVRVMAQRLAEIKPDGTPWTLESNLPMTLRGVEVAVGRVVSPASLELSVSRNDRYDITLTKDGTVVYETVLHQAMSGDSSLVTHTIPLPADLSFDAVLVRPSNGDARYAIGHLRVHSRTQT
jgi:arabinofuranosyltransferase